MDFYQLLGLSRSASADEVERAYRRLARRYHPGINPGDRVAEETFRQIQDAYEVLGDAARRGEYDRGVRDVPVSGIVATVAFEGFDFSAQAEGASAATFSELFADVFHEAARRATTQDAGGALEATLVLSFEHAMRGGHFALSIVRQARCEGCGGDGRLSRRPTACGACGGQGVRRWARGHMVFTTSCETCGGGGQIASQACRTCTGTGTHARSEVVTVSVPPGIENGARVVVPGRGHAGLREDAALGDLYVRIEVTPHAFFRREGRDLYLALPVAVHEAALGAEVDVPTLAGPVRLRIPPGTPAGQRLRIRGHGVFSALGPDRADAGDLIVEVVLALPPAIDQRSRELLREFGRLNDIDVRTHLFER
jgi:molecular chaperone DnaJ